MLMWHFRFSFSIHLQRKFQILFSLGHYEAPSVDSWGGGGENGFSIGLHKSEKSEVAWRLSECMYAIIRF